METGVMQNGPILTVNHWLAKSIGVLGTLVFLFFTFLLFFTKQPLAGIFFFVLAAASLFLFLANGKTEMDKQAIKQISLLGIFKINWDDVRRIEVDPSGNSIVFHGENKRLVIPGRSFWSGKDKKQMIALFDTLVKEKEIKVGYNTWAAFAVSKNTRISNS